MSRFLDGRAEPPRNILWRAALGAPWAPKILSDIRAWFDRPDRER